MHMRRGLVAGLSARSTSLSDVCTVDNLQNALPSADAVQGLSLIASSVAVNAVTNSSSTTMGSSSSFVPYCNASVSYTHSGRNDTVTLELAFPQPSSFENRFYVAGGGGYSLSSSATGGLQYGAAGAATSAGYDAFNQAYDAVVLRGNGSINWDATYAFGYTALGEMTLIAKAILPTFYGLNGTKIYTYFEGCSDGGREGMSQVQRWGAEYDGVIAGAPAFRYAQQQVNHVFPATIEQVQGYLPPPCALQKIVNATIAACDPLDGRTDGVVARTDLCMQEFNLTSVIGEQYYCAASTSTSLGFGFSHGKRQAGSSTSTTPAQNGTVTAADVAIAQAVYDGLHDSSGQRAYLSWQIASALSDAEPTYNSTTSQWTLNIPCTGGEYVTKFVQLQDLSNLSDLDGVTYDTLVDWMQTGYDRYLDSLQTTYPDLTKFQAAGGKLLHYHGESDPSVPAASSVHYWQSVRDVMYRGMCREDAETAMSDWYQLYLVPGAAHCGVNSLQPGPYPQDNMQTMIDWVENGVKPTALNVSVSSGEYTGTQLCQWPTRPYWNDGEMECQVDADGLETWDYEFPAFKVPIY